MPRVLKVVLVITGVLVVIGILLIGVGWYLWSRYGEDLVERGKAIRIEGQEFGSTTDESGCVEVALNDYSKKAGFSGAVAASLLLNGCLENASPTEGFCDGVPSEDEIGASARWRVERCTEAGFSDQSCPNLFSAVQKHCYSKYEEEAAAGEEDVARDPIP